MSLMTGCSSFRGGRRADAGLGSRLEARDLLEAGELYRARKLTESLLRERPGDPETEELMAKILEKEIVRQKEAFESKPPEESTKEEKKAAVRTWLERSEAYTQIGQYDLAIEAAEKVFLYEPENEKASRLIDETKGKAVKEGRKEDLIRQRMLRDEAEARLERYREQTQEAVQAGRWGVAKVAVEKILLLAPEDPDALKLQERIEAQHRQGESEKRKTF